MLEQVLTTPKMPDVGATEFSQRQALPRQTSFADLLKGEGDSEGLPKGLEKLAALSLDSLPERPAVASEAGKGEDIKALLSELQTRLSRLQANGRTADGEELNDESEAVVKPLAQMVRDWVRQSAPEHEEAAKMPALGRSQEPVAEFVANSSTVGVKQPVSIGAEADSHSSLKFGTTIEEVGIMSPPVENGRDQAVSAGESSVVQSLSNGSLKAEESPQNARELTDKRRAELRQAPREEGMLHAGALSGSMPEETDKSPALASASADQSVGNLQKVVVRSPEHSEPQVAVSQYASSDSEGHSLTQSDSHKERGADHASEEAPKALAADVAATEMSKSMSTTEEPQSTAIKEGEALSKLVDSNKATDADADLPAENKDVSQPPVWTQREHRINGQPAPLKEHAAKPEGLAHAMDKVAEVRGESKASRSGPAEPPVWSASHGQKAVAGGEMGQNGSGQSNQGQPNQGQAAQQQFMQMAQSQAQNQQIHRQQNVEKQVNLQAVQSSLNGVEGEETESPLTHNTSLTGADKRPALPAGLQTIGLPVTHQKWGQSLGQRVVYMANNQIQQAQITLNPEKLGPVQIKLHVDRDQQVHVVMSAQQGVTREAMEAAMPRLREMMEQSGIDLASVDISDQRAFSESSADEEQQGQRQAQTDGGQRVDSSEGVEEDSVQTYTTDNLVDYYA